MSTLSIFAKRIKMLRDEIDLTQQQLADKLMFSRSKLNSHENCINQPDMDSVVQYAKFFNVSIDFLYGLTDERTPYKASDKANYLYSSIIDILATLETHEQDELIKNILRYGRFCRKDLQDRR